MLRWMEQAPSPWGIPSAQAHVDWVSSSWLEVGCWLVLSWICSCLFALFSIPSSLYSLASTLWIHFWLACKEFWLTVHLIFRVVRVLGDVLEKSQELLGMFWIGIWTLLDFVCLGQGGWGAYRKLLKWTLDWYFGLSLVSCCAPFLFSCRSVLEWKCEFEFWRLGWSNKRCLLLWLWNIFNSGVARGGVWAEGI